MASLYLLSKQERVEKRNLEIKALAGVLSNWCKLSLSMEEFAQVSEVMGRLVEDNKSDLWMMEHERAQAEKERAEAERAARVAARVVPFPEENPDELRAERLELGEVLGEGLCGNCSSLNVLAAGVCADYREALAE